MLRLRTTSHQAEGNHPGRHGPPGILAPWLATGLGLAALVVIPETEVSNSVVAADVRPLVVAGRASLASAFTDLATPGFTTGILPSTSSGVDGLVSLAAVTEASPLPKPAILDRMFAVSGSPTRSFPAGFEHPLLTTTAHEGRSFRS